MKLILQCVEEAFLILSLSFLSSPPVSSSPPPPLSFFISYYLDFSLSQPSGNIFQQKANLRLSKCQFSLSPPPPLSLNIILLSHQL